MAVLDPHDPVGGSARVAPVVVVEAEAVTTVASSLACTLEREFLVDPLVPMEEGTDGTTVHSGRMALISRISVAITPPMSVNTFPTPPGVPLLTHLIPITQGIKGGRVEDPIGP